MAFIINKRTNNSSSAKGWMNRRSRGWRNWVKTITLLVSASFVFPYLAFAFQPSTYPAATGKISQALAFQANGASVDVASDLGRVVSSFHGKSGKTVVYIHDLHCNYEVQSNIAGLLGNLARKNKLSLIGVEGESKPVNVSRLAAFPRASVKTRTGQYFLKRGRITGAEYLAATGSQPLVLEGIEDQALYDQNKVTLLKFLSEEAQGYCEDLKTIVEKLKAPLYSTDLAKLDHFREQFEGETVSLETYCTFLLEQGKKQGVPLTPFPRLNLFAQEHRLPTASDSDYDKLVDDAADLDRAVRERLYTSPDQRLLDHYAALLKIMANMLSISATAKEIDYYRAHTAEFSVTALVGFLDNLSYRNGVSSNLDTGVVKLDEYLKLAGQFYDVADQRSEAFVENTLQQMDRHRQSLAVLITGGFHNPRVEAAFRAHGVSYLTVKPRITHTYDENPYFSLLRNRRAPVEELLAKSQNNFAPPSAFNDPVFVKYLTSVLNISLVQELMDKSHDSAEFQGAYLQALKEYVPSDGRSLFDFGRMQSNLQKKIYSFPVKGSDYSVVLRPSAVVTDDSASLPFVKAREDLGNGYEFQVVETKALEDHRTQILGLEETRTSAWQSLTSALATVAQGIKTLASSWQPQAVAGVVLVAALAASLSFALPAAALASIQLALVGGVLFSAYVLLRNVRTPAWVRTGTTLGAGLLVMAISQQLGPWVMNLSHAVGQALTPVVSSGHAGYLAAISTLMLPIAGVVGNLTGAQKGFGAGVVQGDDLIARTILFSQQTFGFGKPEFEGTTFRTSVETLVERLQDLSGDENLPSAVRGVLAQALREPQLLALLAVVWHQTPLIPQSVEGAEAGALSPEQKVLAFVWDMAQGEELATLLKDNKTVPVELLQSGNSYLAQLLRAAAPKGLVAPPNQVPAKMAKAQHTDAEGLPVVSLAEMGALPRYQEGAEANIYRINYDGQEAAFVAVKEADPRDTLSYAEGGVDRKKYEDHFLARFKRYQAMQDVQFQGERVAPGVHAVVRDGQGRFVGFVMDFVPGETVDALAKRGALSNSQFQKIGDQVRGQLQALHAKGFFHGSPHAKNVLVTIDAQGEPHARLIDFGTVFVETGSEKADLKAFNIGLMDEGRRLLRESKKIKAGVSTPAQLNLAESIWQYDRTRLLEGLVASHQAWQTAWAQVPAEARTKAAELQTAVNAAMQAAAVEFNTANGSAARLQKSRQALDAALAAVNATLEKAELPADASAALQPWMRAAAALSDAWGQGAPKNAKVTELSLGAGVDALHPERLLALSVLDDQTRALTQLAGKLGVKLNIQGPIFSTVLGFHPEEDQVVSAYAKAVDVARALGVGSLTVQAPLTAEGEAQLGAHAQADTEKNLTAVALNHQAVQPAEEAPETAAGIRVEDQSQAPKLDNAKSLRVRHADLNQLPVGSLVYYRRDGITWEYTLRVEEQGRVSIWLRQDGGRLTAPIQRIGSINNPGMAGVIDLSLSSAMPDFKQTPLGEGPRRLLSSPAGGHASEPEKIWVQLPEGAVVSEQAVVKMSGEEVTEEARAKRLGAYKTYIADILGPQLWPQTASEAPAMESTRQTESAVLFKGVKELGLSEAEMKDLMQAVLAEAKKQPAADLTIPALEEIAGQLLMAKIPALAPEAVLAGVSKDIHAQVKPESFEVLEKRADASPRIGAVRFGKILTDQMPEITNVLNASLSEAQVQAVLPVLQQVATGRLSLSIRMVKEIRGGLAVSQMRGRQLILIVENQLTGGLLDSTIIHEIVEAALASQGVKNAHAVAFLVETGLFPNSLKEKLNNLSHYNNEHLKTLIDTETAEFIQAIRGQKGVTDFVIQQQIANAEKVSQAAAEILASRGIGLKQIGPANQAAAPLVLTADERMFGKERPATPQDAQRLALAALDKDSKLKSNLVLKLTLAQAMSEKSVGLAEFFTGYNSDFDVFAVPAEVFKLLGKIAGVREGGAVNVGGLIIMPEENLQKAQNGDVDALIGVLHEHKHNAYHAVHGYEIAATEHMLVDELYAYFGSFVAQKGAAALVEVHGGKTFTEQVAAKLATSDLYAGSEKSPEKRKDLQARVAAATTVLDAVLQKKDANDVLAYLKTISKLDDILAMATFDSVFTILDHYAKVFQTETVLSSEGHAAAYAAYRTFEAHRAGELVGGGFHGFQTEDTLISLVMSFLGSSTAQRVELGAVLTPGLVLGREAALAIMHSLDPEQMRAFFGFFNHEFSHEFPGIQTVTNGLARWGEMLAGTKAKADIEAAQKKLAALATEGVDVKVDGHRQTIKSLQVIQLKGKPALRPEQQAEAEAIGAFFQVRRGVGYIYVMPGEDAETAAVHEFLEYVQFSGAQDHPRVQQMQDVVEARTGQGPEFAKRARRDLERINDAMAVALSSMLYDGNSWADVIQAQHAARTAGKTAAAKIQRKYAVGNGLARLLGYSSLEALAYHAGELSADVVPATTADPTATEIIRETLAALGVDQETWDKAFSTAQSGGSFSREATEALPTQLKDYLDVFTRLLGYAGERPGDALRHLVNAINGGLRFHWPRKNPFASEVAYANETTGAPLFDPRQEYHIAYPAVPLQKQELNPEKKLLKLGSGDALEKEVHWVGRGAFLVKVMVQNRMLYIQRFQRGANGLLTALDKEAVNLNRWGVEKNLPMLPDSPLGYNRIFDISATEINGHEASMVVASPELLRIALYGDLAEDGQLLPGQDYDLVAPYPQDAKATPVQTLSFARNAQGVDPFWTAGPAVSGEHITDLLPQAKKNQEQAAAAEAARVRDLETKADQEAQVRRTQEVEQTKQAWLKLADDALNEAARQVSREADYQPFLNAEDRQAFRDFLNAPGTVSPAKNLSTVASIWVRDERLPLLKTRAAEKAVSDAQAEARREQAATAARQQQLSAEQAEQLQTWTKEADAALKVAADKSSYMPRGSDDLYKYYSQMLTPQDREAFKASLATGLTKPVMTLARWAEIWMNERLVRYATDRIKMKNEIPGALQAATGQEPDDQDVQKVLASLSEGDNVTLKVAAYVTKQKQEKAAAKEQELQRLLGHMDDALAESWKQAGFSGRYDRFSKDAERARKLYEERLRAGKRGALVAMQAAQKAKASSSKQIGYTGEGEDFAAVWARAQQSENRFNRRALNRLQAQRDKILKALTPYLSVIEYVSFSRNFSALDTLTLATAAGLEGAIGMNQWERTNLQVVLDVGLPVKLAESTVLHETVEAVLKQSGIKHAHALAFIVESEMYPQSLAAKLENEQRYSNGYLQALIDGTGEVVEAIQDADIPNAIRAKQLENAQTVWNTAQQILNDRQQGALPAGAGERAAAPRVTLAGIVDRFKAADPKLLHKGARDLNDLRDPQHTAVKDVYAQTDMEKRPVYQSYPFKTEDGSAFRVWTGERVAVTLQPGQNAILGSTDFSSCAGAVIKGVNGQGETVLELAHLEADNEKGQLPRLQQSLNRLRAQGVTSFQVFVHIDPVNAKPGDGFHNVWPADSAEIQAAVGQDVQLTVDRKPLDAKNQPEMTNVYATPQGIMVEYAHNPGLPPRFFEWSPAATSSTQAGNLSAPQGGVQAVEGALQEAELGITPQSGPTLADRVRNAFARIRPGEAVPASLNLIPGLFQATAQFSATVRGGLLNVLWSGLLALPLGGVVWTAVLAFMGPSLRAALVDQAVARVRSIGSTEETGKVLDFVSALSDIPGMEFTPLNLELPEGARTLNIPNEIIFRPALLHRLLAPILGENNILQLQQRFHRTTDGAA